MVNKNELLSKLRGYVNLNEYNFALHQIRSQNESNFELEELAKQIVKQGLNYKGNSICATVVPLGSGDELTNDDLIINNFGEKEVVNLIVAAPKNVKGISLTFPKRETNVTVGKQYKQTGLIDSYCNEKNVIDTQMILGAVITTQNGESANVLLNCNHLSLINGDEKQSYFNSIESSETFTRLREMLKNPQRSLEVLNTYSVESPTKDYLQQVVQNLETQNEKEL